MVRACLALGLAALFPIQAALDAAKGPPPTVVQTLPPAIVLPVLAGGHRETMADLLEIQATNFIMKTMEPAYSFTDEDRDHLWQLYEGVLTLDPNDADACWRGGLLMAAFGHRPNDGVALLRRGLGLPYTFKGKERPPQQGVYAGHPRRWRLWHEIGATYLLLLADQAEDPVERSGYIRRAGEAWIEASKSAGEEIAPALRQVGEDFAKRGLGLKQRLEQEFELWKQRLNSPHEDLRDEARERLKELESSYRAAALQEIYEEFVRRGRRFRSLRLMVQQGGLKPGLLKDPLGHGFLLHDRQVVSPAAEAARLARNLTRALRAHPGTKPPERPLTPELLRGRPLPRYLDAWIEGDRVIVKPAPDEGRRASDWWWRPAPQAPWFLGS